MLLVCLAWIGVGHAAMPPAGVSIINIATGEFYDQDGDNKNVASNPVNVIIRTVYAAQLTPANDLVVNPADKAYWPHQLINTGNDTDSYKLSIKDSALDSGVLDGLTIIHDINGDGVYQANIDVIYDINKPITLKPQEGFNFFVQGLIPQSINIGDFFKIDLSAVSINEPALVLTRVDRADTVGPQLVLHKNVDKKIINLSSTDTNNTLLTYTLDISNTGKATAMPMTVSIDGKNLSKVVVEDPLPSVVQFKTVDYSGTGQLLYRHINDGEKVYRLFDKANPPLTSTIKSLAIAYDDWAVGKKDQLFIYANATSKQLGSTFDNQFFAYYSFGSQNKEVFSNIVQTQIIGNASTLSSADPKLVEPSELVSWLHLLTNAGTQPDDYSFNLSNVAGDSGDLSGLQLILKGEGGAPDVILAIGQKIRLEAGERRTLEVRGIVPNAVKPNDAFNVNLAIVPLSGVPPILSVTDVANTRFPNLRLIKSVDKSAVDLSVANTNKNLLTYTLSIANTGNANAGATALIIDGVSVNKVFIEDKLSSQLLISQLVYSGTGQVLYHERGTAANSYKTYNSATPPDFSKVDAIGLAWPSFAIGQQDSLVVRARTQAPMSTIVSNQFSASYSYGASSFSTTSNLVDTRIDDKVFTLTAADLLYREPGTVATWTHVLTNTGTLADTYSFSVSDADGDSGILSNIQFIRKTAGGEVILVAGQKIVLQPNESVTLLVKGTLPTNINPNDFFHVNLVATSSSEVLAPEARLDRVISVRPVVELLKEVNTNLITFSDTVQETILSYTLHAHNIGDAVLQPTPITLDGKATEKVLFTDVLPANALLINDREGGTKKAIEYTGSGTILYHLITDPADVYHTYSLTAPMQNPAPAEMDAILLAHDQFPLGMQDKVVLNFKVVSNAVGATISNKFTANYIYGAQERESSSNQVNTVVKGFASIKPKDEYYNQLIARIALNANLHVEASVAQCNLRPTLKDKVLLSIASTRSNDIEQIVAEETDINSGVFRFHDSNLNPMNALPTRDMFTFTPQSGNYIMETTKHDKLIATIMWCLDDNEQKRDNGDVWGEDGKRVSDDVLVDPFGIVFDSVTNQPIKNAIVQLVREDGAQVEIFDDAGRQCVPASKRHPQADPSCTEIITTDDTGSFRYPLVPPTRYKLLITPPAGYTFPSVVPMNELISKFHREIKADGSYGFSFAVTPEAGPVEIDIPLDPPAVFSSTLFVQKTVANSKTTVEVGDFIDYKILVRNASTTTDAQKVIVTDKLPQGFSYVVGSAKIAKVASEPTGGRGPTLVFTVGDLPKDKQVEITYRAQVAASALRGDAINRAKASENIVGGIYSNEAIAQVTVLPGVFSTEAFVTGKVYTDCNRNGVQDPEEIGVPQVRLILEDGSYVITDIEGKYNFYGLRPITHVLKLDRTTLPDDVELIEQSVRNAGDPASVFIDLKASQLHRADFAITTDNATCSGPAMTEIYRRRNQGDNAIGEMERALKADLQFETSNPTDVRALPATGCINSTGNDCGVQGKAKLPTLSSAATNKDDDIIRVVTQKTNKSLEDYLQQEDSNKLAIINLQDQQVLSYAQTNILMKGTLGARFELLLNDEPISDNLIGTKLALAEKRLEAREYIGIDLKAGKNRLSLKQFDPLGNVRGTTIIEVIAPDNLAIIKVEPEQKIVEANGRNEVLVHVKLNDKQDIPVTTRTPVTLETNMGRFRAIDLDDKTPGTQIFVEGGQFTVKLVSPLEAGEATVRVRSGQLKTDANVRFVPELRPMVATGIIEGMVSFKNFDTAKVSAANARDGFEEELQSLASSNDGQLNANGRAAFYLKGKVKGEYLLTLAYDSDKDDKQRLFRDIRPDDYYPVYGDSAVRGFDAQSTSKLYVRLDKGRSYALFGDYNTRIDGTEALNLGQYSRSLTGARAHYETDSFKANTFIAQTKAKQVVEEIRAQGVSGPYNVPNVDGLLVNSEKVEIILRDRNNPGLIIATEQLSRFTDYEFEPLSGNLYFKAPIASLDANLNPYFIRVTLEVQDDAAPDYWVGGVQAEKKITDKLSVGAAVVQEDVPDDTYRLGSVNSMIRLNSNTKIIAEVAQSDREGVEGLAKRVEFNHEKGRTNLRVYYGESDKNFENSAALLSSGRSESGAKLQLALEDWGTLRTEIIRTADDNTGGVRQGIQSSLERSVNKYLALEVGGRYYEETLSPASTSSYGATPYEGITAHTKLKLQLPQFDGASAYLEYEQDIDEANRKLMALGGDYRIGKQGRLYARHEFLSSLSGNFGLNDQQQRNSTVFGFESDYMKDGRVFSEYRVRDAISARDAEAAVGLRNRWYIAKDIRINTNLERITTLEGDDNTDATAVGLGLDYLANPLWKATGKIDLRWSAQADTILNTLGLAYKLSRDWTLLARNTINFTDNHINGDRLQDRFQLGAAYRQVDTNRWDALTKVEYKVEQDDNTSNPIDRHAYIFSTHANYHPVRRWTFAGNYAGKWVTDTLDDLESRSDTHMVGLRAIHDITERWEASAQGGWLGGDTGGKRYVLGVETGYLITANLWLSGGYNFMSYQDDDVVGSEFTVDGVYMRIRFKFDEDLFRSDRPSINKTLEPQHVGP
ncbi:SdrD B-like domain-containing protein [Agitococcus lubricus]|nr:SdrD B-like domain-containing protein [Agitococcus lubricus]